jgi:hypothetical protein
VISRSGELIFKNYGSSQSRRVQVVAGVAQNLRESGVRTPAAIVESLSNTIVSSWINGPTLRQVLEISGPFFAAGELRQFDPLFREVLSTIATIHMAHINAVAIAPIDSFRTIDQRVGEGVLERLPAGAVGSFEALLASLKRQTASIKPSRTIHGDCHVGQVIFDYASGQWWVLDLDDVALGVPEHDLANFAAHLVSTSTIFKGDLISGIADMTAIIDKHYEGEFEIARYRTLVAVSLMRRAIKFLQKFGYTPKVKAFFAACEELQG